MDYPGNPSLAPEVQRRIKSTYEQSRQLAAEGKRQEALLGCDFMLQLDPDFEPAAALKARIEEGDELFTAGDTAPAGPGESPAPEPTPPTPPTPPGEPAPGEDDPFALGSAPESGFEALDDDLDDLDLPDLDLGGLPEELPESGLPAGAADPPRTDPPAAAATGPSGELARELAERLEKRDFQGVLDRASEERSAVAADPRLQEIATAALERLQAQSYVEHFLDEARRALTEGDRARVAAQLDQARALDPGNPLIVELELAAQEDDAAPSLAAAPDLPSIGLGDEAPAAEPPAGDAPPTPAAEPAAPPPAAAPPGGPSDRIAELLAEGQAAFERREFQEAIDAWSRIFLIDVDHAEAASRIEEARRLKAEQERQAEELFHEGQRAAEAGDAAGAREKLERVLELQPNHLPAKEALQRLDQPGAAAGAFRAPSMTPPEPADEALELEEEILVPPDPGAESAPAATGAEAPGRRLVAVKKQSSPRLFLLIGGAVLVAVLAGAWFLLQHGESLFPNREPEIETPVAPTVRNPLAEARRLHGEGRTAIALAQLKRLRPDDPYYDQAQELIAEWERAGGEPILVPEVTEEAAALRLRLLEAAGEAFAGREYLRAAELYQAAEEVAPLDPGDFARYEEARQRLEPLAQEIELVRNGEYEFVLPRLWSRYQEDPSDRVVRRLIVDVYHNLGVRELQRGDPRTAAGHFEEALELTPDDEEIQRLFLFAETYGSRSRDLLYRIYVKYLPMR